MFCPLRFDDPIQNSAIRCTIRISCWTYDHLSVNVNFFWVLWKTLKESLFNQARQAGAEEGTLDQFQPSSSSRNLLEEEDYCLESGETPPAVPQQTEVNSNTITFWTIGFTVNDGPFRRLDDPQNSSFLEVVQFLLLNPSLINK